eukprot:768372-Hanusia_phi.AAC.2
MSNSPQLGNNGSHPPGVEEEKVLPQQELRRAHEALEPAKRLPPAGQVDRCEEWEEDKGG